MKTLKPVTKCKQNYCFYDTRLWLNFDLYILQGFQAYTQIRNHVDSCLVNNRFK